LVFVAYSSELIRLLTSRYRHVENANFPVTDKTVFSGGIGFAHAQMPELLRGRMGRAGPGNHLGMGDQRPAIPEPDATGQKKSQAERYNPERQARSRTQNRR
jgi:hypothetical protein